MSDTPIYDQLAWEYANAAFSARMRETAAKVKAVFDNHNQAMAALISGLRPMMQAAFEAERRRQEQLLELSAWVQRTLNPAPTRGYGISFAVIDEMDPRARALSQTNKRYPTSTPSWERRSRR